MTSKKLETIDLVQRDGIYYEQFSDIPFTGETTQGSFKCGKKINRKTPYRNTNGIKEGFRLIYHFNGQLSESGEYINDKKTGPWVSYWENGQLKSKGSYINGKKEGNHIKYYKNGTVWEENTGIFKDDKKISRLKNLNIGPNTVDIIKEIKNVLKEEEEFIEEKIRKEKELLKGVKEQLEKNQKT